ncbi:Cell morphogenesis protein PAG1, partial [Borealophlyctis nickersoniae]
MQTLQSMPPPLALSTSISTVRGRPGPAQSNDMGLEYGTSGGGGEGSPATGGGGRGGGVGGTSGGTTPPGAGAGGGGKSAVLFVLQNVFARFVRAAETKLNSLVFMQLERDLDLSTYVRAGHDPSFDCLLESMGSIAKHCPKLMIDSVMVWRKSKSESSASESVQYMTSIYPNVKGKDVETVIRERKSLVANFILCRVLIEIIQRLTRDTMPNDLGEKLEDMVFGQLRNADPDLTARPINRQANVDLFAELIGALSNIRFVTVSDRFVAELKVAGTMKENKLEMIIKSMRFLKLKIYPMEYLEETAEFLEICADLFQNTHSVRIKHAFADVFVHLLDPIAAVATAEVNVPAWMRTVETIYSKANRMIAKPRHLQAALPLMTTLLSVSRRDFFHRHFPTFLDLLTQKLRDKHLKTAALSSITRLIWVYLFRCAESSSAVAHKKLEGMFRVLFPAGRRGTVVGGGEIGVELFVMIVYFVCVRYPEFGVTSL